MFLGRPCQDYDFVTPFDPTCLARRFSRKIRGHWFMLDEKRRQSRVVVDDGDVPIQCDFAPLRSSSLVCDLGMRDYRINAMVWRVRERLGQCDFYDPFSGYEDLRCGRLVACGKDVLDKDPLRVLKGVRHCKTLGLAPDNATGALMVGAARLLPTVAAERVRKELGLLLADASPDAALQWLWRCGASGHILGPWSLAVKKTTLVRRLNRFGGRVRQLCHGEYAPLVRRLLRESFEEGITRHAMLNLAAVLLGRSADEIDRVSATLKLSRVADRALRDYLSMPVRRFGELVRGDGSERGRYWWISGLGADPLGCLLFLACRCDGDRVQRALSLAAHYSVAGKQRDLVDGGWIMRNLGVAPGPKVGDMLRALRQEEIAGRVHTIGQARRFLLLHFKKTD